MKRLIVRYAAVISRLIVPVAVLVAVAGGTAVSAAGDGDRELALPVVPDSLREPAERADYVLMHFWDAMEWGDTTLAGDEKWMEQTFVNFASVMPYASSLFAVEEAFDNMFGRARDNQAAYRLLLNFADRYLYEPESPMYDETLYLCALDVVLRDAFLDPVLLSRYSYQHDEAMKNRPGQPAADFTLVDVASGERSTLRNEVNGSGETLVVFYDPECDHCIDVIKSLDRSSSVRSRIESGSLKVVAVYFEGEEAMLDDVKGLVAAGWTSVYTPGNPVEEEELYAIRRLPTLYLLSSDATVKAKDVSLEKLLDDLSD